LLIDDDHADGEESKGPSDNKEEHTRGTGPTKHKQATRRRGRRRRRRRLRKSDQAKQETRQQATQATGTAPQTPQSMPSPTSSQALWVCMCVGGAGVEEERERERGRWMGTRQKCCVVAAINPSPVMHIRRGRQVLCVQAFRGREREREGGQVGG
jgi:hypothetical protein